MWCIVGMYENESKNKKVKDLKPGMSNVDIKVRVLEASPPKTIQTKKGERTISEAVVGDETGRVKLTLWGRAAGTIKEGDAIEIKGGWTTAYRGEVQLNIGGRDTIQSISDEEVPKEEEVPEERPKAPERRFRKRF